MLRLANGNGWSVSGLDNVSWNACDVKNKFKFSKFKDLNQAIKQVSIDINDEDKDKKINLIFSPCAASFDKYKNFEERGRHFNYLINSYKIKNAR